MRCAVAPDRVEKWRAQPRLRGCSARIASKARRALELSAAPCVEGVEVAALAVRGAALGRGAAGGFEAPARLAGQRRHAEEHEEVPFHAVREDHLRIRGKGVLEAISGFLSEPQVLRECRIEAAHRRVVRGGRLESACIQHHGLHRGKCGPRITGATPAIRSRGILVRAPNPGEAAASDRQGMLEPPSDASVPGTSYPSQPRTVTQETTFGNLTQQATRCVRGAVWEYRHGSRCPAVDAVRWRSRLR